MNKGRLVELLLEALADITELRLFETERGYQRELLSTLKARLPEAEFDGDPIVEGVHQKRLVPHGVRIRPDLIIHIPFNSGVTERRDEGNFVAIEIKRDKQHLQAAFDNLVKLKERLGYARWGLQGRTPTILKPEHENGHGRPEENSSRTRQGPHTRIRSYGRVIFREQVPRTSRLASTDARGGAGERRFPAPARWRVPSVRACEGRRRTLGLRLEAWRA